MPTPSQRSTITLRALPDALIPAPLRDLDVRRIVRSTAEAIAERTGVTLVALDTDEKSLTATLEGPQVVALGFAAELRRLTDAWHRSKFGVELWGDAS